MNDDICDMTQLKAGQSAVVECIDIYTNMRRRLLDIGLVCGTKIECVLKSPAKDPAAYKIRGAVIAIRNDDAKKIKCKIKFPG